MQLTDWLVVIFIVAIVVVLVDGVRRKLAERRHRVVMKLDRNIPQDIDPEDLPNSELPNGGARTLERAGSPPPSLRTLQARKRFSFRSTRAHEDAGARAVPVLLDTVDIEEERIEHTNVFGDPHAVEGFQADDFASADPADVEDLSTARVVARQQPAEDGQQHDELIDGLDEEYEEDTMLAPEVSRKEPGYMDTRYMGRRDEDDEDDYEEEEFEEEEEEEDDEEEDDFEEFDDDLEDADELDDEEDEEDDDDYDDEDDEDDEEEDDYEDEEEDEEDDEDDYDDDEEEDEEDLDELEGLPEDEWGAEEEQDRLVDDYENEPMPLQEAFDKAASKLDRVASQAATQLDKVASHAATHFDRAAAQAASHLKRPPREDRRRIEPGFGANHADDGSADNFDEPLFTEDLSASWAEPEFDDAAELAPRPRAERAASAATTRREQGELFGAGPAGKDAHEARDKREGREGREESRLMAALHKAVPTRAQAAPGPAPAAPLPQEVIVINVMARSGQLLHGGDLLRVLQGQGMRLGDMSIFHRHADSQGVGPVMFSMANMVKPGTFDLATMEEFTTPGVSFFLQMPNKLGNMASFDKMLATASAVRDAFDAELKDEQRSVITRQTVEHCRQRVRDFELKLLSRK